MEFEKRPAAERQGASDQAPGPRLGGELRYHVMGRTGPRARLEDAPQAKDASEPEQPQQLDELQLRDEGAAPVSGREERHGGIKRDGRQQVDSEPEGDV